LAYISDNIRKSTQDGMTESDFPRIAVKADARVIASEFFHLVVSAIKGPITKETHAATNKVTKAVIHELFHEIASQALDGNNTEDAVTKNDTGLAGFLDRSNFTVFGILCEKFVLGIGQEALPVGFHQHRKLRRGNKVLLIVVTQVIRVTTAGGWDKV